MNLHVVLKHAGWMCGLMVCCAGTSDLAAQDVPVRTLEYRVPQVTGDRLQRVDAEPAAPAVDFAVGDGRDAVQATPVIWGWGGHSWGSYYRPYGYGLSIGIGPRFGYSYGGLYGYRSYGFGYRPYYAYRPYYYGYSLLRPSYFGYSYYRPYYSGWSAYRPYYSGWSAYRPYYGASYYTSSYYPYYAGYYPASYSCSYASPYVTGSWGYGCVSCGCY